MQGRLLAVVLSIGITAVVATEPDFAKLTEDLRGLNDLGDIGELFKGLEEVMEMFGGPDGCEFNCEAGEVKVPNADHEPTHNGCGAFGAELAIEDRPEVSECCNQHDICYDMCGNNRTICDLELKRCTADLCAEAVAEEGASSEDSFQACMILSDLIYQSASLVGCKPYKEAQRSACLCVPDGTAVDKDEL